MPKRILLGPQRPSANLREVLTAAALPEGPVGVISAGWQEGEGELDDLSQLIQNPLVELNLYHRADNIFSADKAFQSVYRQRQDRLQELQKLYRTRLRHLMIAARQIRRQKVTSGLIAAEQQHAISQVRALDTHLLSSVETIYSQYAEALKPSSSALLTEQIQEIESVLENCASIVIPGGNVLVLLNRLQLFEMQHMIHSRHVVAWSAGAMALSDIIVLYHDRVPLGRRDPEVLGPGLGIVSGHLFLPDSKKRLQVKDRVRISLFSQRFAPVKCVTLNSGSSIYFDDESLCQANNVGKLTAKGKIEELLPT